MRRGQQNNTLTDNTGEKEKGTMSKWIKCTKLRCLSLPRVASGWKWWSVWFSELAWVERIGGSGGRGVKIQRGGDVGQPSVRIWVRAKRANNVTKPKLTGPASSLSFFFYLSLLLLCGCVSIYSTCIFFLVFFGSSRRLRFAISHPSRRHIFSASWRRSFWCLSLTD